MSNGEQKVYLGGKMKKQNITSAPFLIYSTDPPSLCFLYQKAAVERAKTAMTGQTGSCCWDIQALQQDLSSAVSNGRA